MNFLWKKAYLLVDALWKWVSEQIFVRFDFQIPSDKIANPKQLVFALPGGGVIDWLILSSWSRKNGLGPILVANRKRVLILARPCSFFRSFLAKPPMPSCF